MKLSKTEKALLSEALEHPSNIVGADIVRGRGSKGGKVYEGARRFYALKSLIKKGFLMPASNHTAVIAENGYTINVVSITAKTINEA